MHVGGFNILHCEEPHECSLVASRTRDENISKSHHRLEHVERKFVLSRHVYIGSLSPYENTISSEHVKPLHSEVVVLVGSPPNA